MHAHSAHAACVPHGWCPPILNKQCVPVCWSPAACLVHVLVGGWVARSQQCLHCRQLPVYPCGSDLPSAVCSLACIHQTLVPATRMDAGVSSSSPGEAAAERISMAGLT